MGRVSQGYVVLPQGYLDLPDSRRDRIIPICIAACDQCGHLINPDWFTRGVEPVRGTLIRIARYFLGDAWCASELAEKTVHRLWCRHGEAIGDAPHRRVVKKAMRVAVEMSAGDWRRLKHPKLYAALELLDEKLRDQVLVDPRQNPELFERQILLDIFEERLGREGRAELQLAFRLFRRGFAWDVIAQKTGAGSAENLKRRFYRWAKQAGAGKNFPVDSL